MTKRSYHVQARLNLDHPRESTAIDIALSLIAQGHKMRDILTSAILALGKQGQVLKTARDEKIAPDSTQAGQVWTIDAIRKIFSEELQASNEKLLSEFSRYIMENIETRGLQSVRNDSKLDETGNAPSIVKNFLTGLNKRQQGDL